MLEQDWYTKHIDRGNPYPGQSSKSPNQGRQDKHGNQIPEDSAEVRLLRQYIKKCLEHKAKDQTRYIEDNVNKQNQCIVPWSIADQAPDEGRGSHAGISSKLD